MKNKKSLITRSIIKIAIAIILCFVITLASNAFAPHLTNDLAIGQLENDDISWSLMQSWYAVQNALTAVELIIFAVCGCSIGVNVYHYFKIKGENRT